MNNGRILPLLLAAIAACCGCTDTISGHGGSMKPPPPTPTFLAGSFQVNGRECDLTWVPGSGNQSGFRIEVNTAPFGTPPYVGVFFVGANQPNYTYSAPLPNTTYYFRVYAITGSAQSDPSNVINVTAGDFPMPPQWFSALATSASTVQLRMLNGATDTGNKIERSTDQLNWTTVFDGPTGPNLRTVLDGGLSQDTVYYYRGYAKIGTVLSDVSETSSSRTQYLPLNPMVVTASGGAHTSIAFDDFLVHRIVSYDVWSMTLQLTTGNFPPSLYNSTTIGFGQGNGYHGCSVATNNVGAVFVASHVYQSDTLEFISNQANVGTFSPTTIDSDPFFNYDIVGKDPVIRVSPADQSIHIVYKVQTSVMGDGHLRHAWRGPNVGDSWSTETAVNYEPVMREHSFIIDGAGDLHIVYASRPGGIGPSMLKHARRLPGGGWTFAIITQEGVPLKNSVAVGPSNSLHVAYHDDARGSLWYATDRTGSWKTEEVHAHTGDNIGLDNSIVYASKNSADVHIAYYEQDNANLWYAGKKGVNGTWNRKLIDSTDDVGRYPCINADSFDIYITYLYFSSMNGFYWLKAVRNPQD